MIAEHLSSIKDVRRDALEAARPPPKLSLSEWADQYYYLSAESAAEHGRWKTLPYQRGIMDAFTDPTVEQVSVMKAARVGWTKMLNALVGYYIHQDPCPILLVQPTVDDAKGYSKEEIAPMIRDCPVLSKIVLEDADEVGPKDSGNTMLHKRYPGGVFRMVGANSGTGFRRISARAVLFDEVDAYPPSAGSDGDQIELGTKRTQHYWNRKIGAGSTPLVAGASRIERLFEAGDQRRFYVPCPQCGHMDFLVFTQRDSGGHWMQFDTEKPEDACFVCSANGCVIEHKQKLWMLERGEWRADKPFEGHASFHIWAAYSTASNATWGQLAAEFVAAKGNSETLRTFVNTVLGETWQERGDAPEWERLYNRREHYAIGTVPEGVKFLTCGVDVQKDRWVYEVVGWAYNKESWSIDSGVIMGDTSNDAEWLKLDELLGRTYPRGDETDLGIRMLAVDSGYNTQTCYNWGRRHQRDRVMAVKGNDKAGRIIGLPSDVDVTSNGKRFARAYKVWTVGVNMAKSELYGWLRLPAPEEGIGYPAGFCHFPEYSQEFFKQLTSEHLVSKRDMRGFQRLEWQLLPGRENHQLDCRVYARAAAVQMGLDRIRTQPAPIAKAVAAATVKPVIAPAPAPRPQINRPQPARADSRLLSKYGNAQSWLRRKR